MSQIYSIPNATFRPLDQWTGERTKNRRQSNFSAPWRDTLDRLNRELRFLAAKHIVVMIDIPERQFRQDGQPRADARANSPGVIMAFDSKYGPLKYPCDTFTDWQDNIRAIALALEALRSVDRYGVTRRAEQYTGWRALPAGRTDAAMTVEQAALYIDEAAIVGAAQIMTNQSTFLKAYRDAAAYMHPDAGGTHEDFVRLQEAKRVLDEHHERIRKP